MTARTLCCSGSLVLAVFVAGCGSEEPVDRGASCTLLSWDPDDGQLTRWPEPDLVEADAATKTGYRLRLSDEDFEIAPSFKAVFTEDLNDLDGFGVGSELFFRFSRAFDETLLPSADDASSPRAGLGLLVLEPGEPRVEPAFVRTTDEGATLLLAPMRPLPERATVAAYVTRELTEAARGCLEPSSSMAARLESPDEDEAAAVAALTTLGVIDSASDLVALTLFPTQSITPDALAIAADIRDRSYALDGPATCVDETRWIRCVATFTAQDYRGSDEVIRQQPGQPVQPSGEYQVPLTVWLPPEGVGERPYTTLVYGHGLGSGRGQGSTLAGFTAPLGFAAVAIPAVQHGEHPSVEEGESTTTVGTALRFFTVEDLEDRPIWPLVLRDNFRQSTLDKLQLTRLLEEGLDLDGDGESDLAQNRLAYVGVSLGASMGVELLALTDVYRAAVLVAPGGRLTAIMSDSGIFGPIFSLMRPRGTTDGDAARFYAVMQTLLDRGDPASFGRHVVVERLEGAGRVPSVLAAVVLDDGVVPNSSTYFLARGMGFDIIPPILRPVPGLAEGPAAPVSGNAADGASTAGLLQFDVIREESGDVVPATHDNIGDSEVGVQAWLDFLTAHFDEGLARIEDPYEATGLSHAGP